MRLEKHDVWSMYCLAAAPRRLPFEIVNERPIRPGEGPRSDWPAAPGKTVAEDLQAAPEYTEDRRRTAYHEASHAVLAAAVGAPVTRIVLDDDRTGRCMLDPSALQRLDVELHAALNVSGLVGEKRAGLTASWITLQERCADDFSNLRATLFRAGAGAGWGAMKARAFILADSVLAERWPKVERLAGVLADRGELTGAEVVRLLE